jgi:sarcosine oxidase delta subunit
MIKVICAWCGKHLRDVEEKTEGNDRISHGICPDCHARQMLEVKAMQGKKNVVPSENENILKAVNEIMDSSIQIVRSQALETALIEIANFNRKLAE